MPEMTAQTPELAWNTDGLMPVVVQDAQTREVLMLAWMDRVALERTLEERRMVYWSRSRREYWRKGDTSGHVQRLRSLQYDCDADVLLATVDQTGAACHTGTHSCFDTRYLYTGEEDSADD